VALCRYCEEVETPKGGRCAACRREYQRAYREKRRETHPDYFKGYYRENRERRKAQARSYASTRLSEYAERSRAWRKENPETARATKAAYRAANPEKIRRWTAWANWRRRDGDPPSAETLNYADILRRDVCAYCGGVVEEIDHIDPLVGTGTNSWSNLAPSCLKCNRQKSTKPLLLFMLRA
jgi:hypothetical protein